MEILSISQDTNKNTDRCVNKWIWGKKHTERDTHIEGENFEHKIWWKWQYSFDISIYKYNAER